MATSYTTASSINEQALFGSMAILRTRRLNGHSLRSDEKLIYTYHFRTSQYNTIAAKAAAYTVMAVSHPISADVPAFETLTPSLIGEPFDIYDLRRTYFRINASYSIAPLVRFTDPLLNSWQVNWVKPRMYDYYANIKLNPTCTSLRLERSSSTFTVSTTWGTYTSTLSSETPDTSGIPPFRTVWTNPYNPTILPLSDNEVTPLSALVGALVGGSFTNTATTGGTTNTANLILDWRTQHTVRKDFLRLKTITSDLAYRCPPFTESFLGEPLRTQLLAFQNISLQRIYTGNYQARMHFQPPPTCMPFTDGQAITVGTPGMVTFYNPIGPSPLIINAGAGGPVINIAP